MASAYFNAAVDNYWDTPGNWWSDPTFTTPLSTWDGLPASGDDIYVYNSINSYMSTAPNSLGNGYFYGNGFNNIWGLYANINLTFSGDVVLNNGFAISGYTGMYGPSWYISGTITFNDNSVIANGVGGFYYPISITAGTVIFNDTSGGNTAGSAITGNTTLNDSASISGITFNSDVTLNNSSSITYASPSNNGIYGSTINLYNSSYIEYTTLVSFTAVLSLYDTSSANYINGTNPYSAIIYYPGTATFSNGFNYTLKYSGFSLMYFYGGGGDWNDINNWYVDSGHSQYSAEYPSITTDVIIDSSVSYDSGSGASCKNLTIGSNNSLNLSLNIDQTATFNDSSWVNMGGVMNGTCVFNDTSYVNSGGSVTTATFNDTSFNYGSVTTATFKDTSYNFSGGYVGTAIFGSNGGTDTSYNAGTVTGTATFYANTTANSGGILQSTSSFYDDSSMLNGCTVSDVPSFYDNSINYNDVSGVTFNFYNSSSNQAVLSSANFYNTSDNSGSCENPTYDDSSTATSATYTTNLNITITGNPVNSYTMNTGLQTYSFTRGGGGGGGGINGSSILGIL